MSEKSHFALFEYQVPEPPDDPCWAEYLRWLICVMNGDDTALHFIASVLSYNLRGGITERQARAAQKILDRVLHDFRAGVLDCQMNVEMPDCDDESRLGSLASMKPKGSA